MRRRLSSIGTFYGKFVFPTIWILGFGAATAALWMGDLHGKEGEAPPEFMKWLFLSGWLAGSGFLFWHAQRLRKVEFRDGQIWVADYFHEMTVPLSAIDEVDQSFLTRPQTITLHFKTETALGMKAVFIPRGLSTFVTKHPIAVALEELIAEERKNAC